MTSHLKISIANLDNPVIKTKASVTLVDTYLAILY